MKNTNQLWYVVDYISKQIVSQGCASEIEAQLLARSLSTSSPNNTYQVVVK